MVKPAAVQAAIAVGSPADTQPATVTEMSFNRCS
jgi:hypothetical protein